MARVTLGKELSVSAIGRSGPHSQIPVLFLKKNTEKQGVGKEVFRRGKAPVKTRSWKESAYFCIFRMKGEMLCLSTSLRYWRQVGRETQSRGVVSRVAFACVPKSL